MYFPLTLASRYRVTSAGWDVVWEIKYWGLRTINIDIFCLLINKLNKEELCLTYFCVFWCEFIVLVHFLASVTPVSHSLTGGGGWRSRAKKWTKSLNSKRNTQTYIKGKSSFNYLVYWSKGKIYRYLSFANLSILFLIQRQHSTDSLPWMEITFQPRNVSLGSLCIFLISKTEKRSDRTIASC